MNGKELKKIRKELNLTQIGLAEKVGVGIRALQYWESDDRKIPSTTIVFIRNLLKSEQNAVLNNSIPHMLRIKELRKKKNLTQKKIAEELGVKVTTFSGYETGYSKPDIYKLKKYPRYSKFH